MDAKSPSAVELKNVARRFVTPTGEILSALEDFDLTIAPGEFFAIVGPTGCGKSTTLGLIAGLAKPQAGEVTLFDAPVDGVDSRVGFVFQQDAVFPWRNVLGNVMAGPLFRGVPKRQGRSDRARLDQPRRAEGLRGPPSAPALRRHAQARGAGADLHQQSAGAVDGRAVLGARRADPRADAGRAAAAMGAGEVGGAVRHPRSRRGDRARRPRRGADHAPGAGEVGAHHRPAAPARRRRNCATTNASSRSRATFPTTCARKCCAHGAGH